MGTSIASATATVHASLRSSRRKRQRHTTETIKCSIWGSDCNFTNYDFRNALELSEDNLARGAKFKGLLAITVG